MDTMNLSVGTVNNNPPPMSNSDHASNPKQGASFSGPHLSTRAQNGGGINQRVTNRNKSRGGGQHGRRGRHLSQSYADNLASATRSNKPEVRNKSSKGSTSAGGSRNKQRHTTNMNLDELDELTLAGLDIDLAESIVPTTSAPVSSSHHQTRQVRSASSRKLNLTHLLNYKFDGRNRSYASGNQNSSSFRSSGGHPLGYNNYNRVRPMRFSKQQFLQANCQFVVLSGHDYSIHKADPDLPVEWDKVEEIRFFQTTTTETTCPICLNPPIAAKITRCGHIYCWPCMLHYLSLSDENCRLCPICFEIVYRTDLRSVVSHTYKNYSTEDDITLRLMVRSKGSVEVFPYPDDSADEVRILDGAESTDCTMRRNLLIVDGQTVLDNIIERECKQLELQREADKDEPEVCFVMQALSLLSRRKESMKKRIESMLIAEIEALGCDKDVTDVNSTAEHGLNVKTPVIMSDSPLDYKIDAVDNRGSKNYLFYQSSDGQHIYLNAFNTKILCHEYQSFDHCPLIIKAKIIQMDSISMDEARRRRYRFLEHLPLTCEFRLVEIELSNYEYVSRATYKHFEGEIMKRELERQRRMKEERKREKIIRVEQNRKIYGVQPSLKISLDNPDQFPSVMDERFLGLGQLPLNIKTKNDDIVSSDEDEEDQSLHLKTSDQDNNQDHHNQHEVDTGQTCVGPNAGTSIFADSAPLSFREIQLQEAAASELAEKNKKRAQAAKTAWGQQSSIAQLLVDPKQNNSNNDSTSVRGQQTSIQSQLTTDTLNQDRADSTASLIQQQSSFAKLLAKSSEKQWSTKVAKQPTSSNNNWSNPQHASLNLPSASRSKTRTFSNQTDYSDDELPPSRPTHEFTLADYIQINVITSKKKSKKNSKKMGSPAK